MIRAALVILAICLAQSIPFPGPGTKHSTGYAAYRSVTFNNHPLSDKTNFNAFVCANGAASTNCDSSAHSNLAIANLKTTGNGGLVTSASGYDIGFASDTGCTSMLSYELAAGTYVASTGAGEWWVQIPTLSSSVDTVIYICYGNPAITTDQSTTAAWNSHFKGVYHLPNGTALTALDSTLGARNGTLVNTPTAAAGQIFGGGLFAKASSQYIKNTASAPVTAYPFALSAWVKLTDTTFGTGEARNITIICNPANTNQIGFRYINNGSTPQLWAFAATGSVFITFVNLGTFNTGWHHLVATFADSTHFGLAIDGTFQSVGTAGSAQSLTDMAGVIIGAQLYNTSSVDSPMQGTIDEAHVWDNNLDGSGGTTATGDGHWIKAEYDNQNAPSSYYTFGSEVIP